MNERENLLEWSLPLRVGPVVRGNAQTERESGRTANVTVERSWCYMGNINVLAGSPCSPLPIRAEL